MKKIASLAALTLILAGCGAHVPATQAPLALAPAATVAKSAPLVPLAQAPVDPDAAKAAPAVADPMTAALGTAQAIAHYGPLITGTEALGQDEPTPAYAVQTSPERTQEKADAVAHEWSADAKQLWLGWGFKTFSLFGRSRHVYFSSSKKRLLTVDYGFFGQKIGQYETTGLIVQYAGKLISALLDEPRDIHPISGREAYYRAHQNGYLATQATVKVIMIDPLIVGAQWVFLDASGKPALTVDANTGEVHSGGTLLQLLGYLF